MSLPIVCIPPVLNTLLTPYRSIFSKLQYNHFRRLVTGHIVSGNKTLQEINDGFGECDQSNLNRFVSHSSWDLDDLNKLRISQVKDTFSLRKKGTIIIDESLVHKTGKKMELAGLHRSGITKKVEWGHMLVNSFYTDSEDHDFPVKSELYVRKSDCAEIDRVFKTKREIAIELVDFALSMGLPLGLVLADAGYEGEEFTRELIIRKLDFLIGVRTTTNISINREKRISIADYLNTLTDSDFDVHIDEEKAYFYRIQNVYIRGIGAVKLVISYSYGDEENVK